MHLSHIEGVSGEPVDLLKPNLKQVLLKHILNRVAETFLLSQDLAHLLKNHSLAAVANEGLVAALQDTHSVQNFPFSFLTGTACFTNEELILGSVGILLLSVELDLSTQVILLDFRPCDLFKSVLSAFITQKLQENSRDLLQVSPLVVLN